MQICSYKMFNFLDNVLLTETLNSNFLNIKGLVSRK